MIDNRPQHRQRIFIKDEKFITVERKVNYCHGCDAGEHCNVIAERYATYSGDGFRAGCQNRIFKLVEK